MTTISPEQNVEDLLLHGADPEIMDKNGKKAIDYAPIKIKSKLESMIDSFTSTKRPDLFEIWIYERSGSEPIGTATITTTTTISEVFPDLGSSDKLAIGGRILNFDPSTSLMTAIILTKQSSTRYLDFPIAIVKNPVRFVAQNTSLYRANLQKEELNKDFNEISKVKIGNDEVTIKVGELEFQFPKNCVQSPIELRIKVCDRKKSGDTHIPGHVDFLLEQTDTDPKNKLMCFNRSSLPTIINASGVEYVYLHNEMDLPMWFGHAERSRKNRLLVPNGIYRLVPLA